MGSRVVHLYNGHGFTTQCITWDYKKKKWRKTWNKSQIFVMQEKQEIGSSMPRKINETESWADILLEASGHTITGNMLRNEGLTTARVNKMVDN